MFSVVIPLYNKEDFVEKSIESVLNQTLQNFELIVVNDGSTDKSVDKVSKYQNTKLKIITQKNSGVSSARNKGILEAQYPYIAFLDADDWWETEFLSAIYNLTTDYPECKVFATSYFKVKNTKKVKFKSNLPENYKGEINYFSSYSSNWWMPITSSSVVIKKDSIVNIGGFNTNLKFGEDIDLWLRLAIKNNIIFVNKPLANYNQDIPTKLRAIGNQKIWKKENHYIFNLEYLYEEEQKNPELKHLLDGLRLRALMRYYLGNKYTNEVKYLLAKVNFDEHTSYFKRIYFSPKFCVKAYFSAKKMGSYIKQKIINNFIN